MRSPGRFGVVLAVLLILGWGAGTMRAQETPSADAPPEPDKGVSKQLQEAPPVERHEPEAAAPQADVYDPAIFVTRIPQDQLAFLSGLQGTTTNDAMRDKQFKRLMKQFVPDCMFHYGRDMPLQDALETVLQGSRTPVQIRDGRYFTASGNMGPYLRGRAFLWIDMKEGIGLGGFYFHPTNGEPTPTVAVFSRQVKEKAIGMSDLPPEFAADLYVWSGGSGIPPVTTRYFLTGSNKRVLLEHDEDYCSAAYDSLVAPGTDCLEMDADAADLDEVAAYYLDQVHYATNATAWMIGPDQVAWLGVRDRTCGGVVDPLGCRIIVTREHTRTITGRPGPRPVGGPHPRAK
jgi:uncharacterized protein YecT (DUF1311 family)